MAGKQKKKPLTVADKIERGLREAIRFARGEKTGAIVHVVRVKVPDNIDVRTIRHNRGMTQATFARRYGFALSALRDWEQGRRRPERSARILLLVIEREPEAVERALTR